MNIFYLDADPELAAQAQCNKHVVKMIVETAQLLSTAHRMLDGSTYADQVGLYKSTHVNHPSNVWVRSGLHNYQWAHQHFVALLCEYTLRYGKIHASDRLVSALETPPENLVDTEFTEPPQCMPDVYKQRVTVEAYRDYYAGEKAGFCKWSKRGVPNWFVTRTLTVA